MGRVGHVEHVEGVGEVVASAEAAVEVGGEGVGHEGQGLAGAVEGTGDVAVAFEESLAVEAVDAGTEGGVEGSGFLAATGGEEK
jgi:hypothetical protein